MLAPLLSPCLAECSTAMPFFVPTLSFWSGFECGVQGLLHEALLCRHDILLILVRFALKGSAMGFSKTLEVAVLVTIMEIFSEIVSHPTITVTHFYISKD